MQELELTKDFWAEFGAQASFEVSFDRKLLLALETAVAVPVIEPLRDRGATALYIPEFDLYLPCYQVGWLTVDDILRWLALPALIAILRVSCVVLL